jgi:predicted acyl esterase
MKKIPMLGAVLGALAFAPAAAQAAPITQVFNDAQAAGGAPAPIACTTRGATVPAQAGQRWCGTANGFLAGGNLVRVWDGTPIDVSVALPPAPASGDDGGFPIVGIYHGYGGFKLAQGDVAVQRWVGQGYAVISITDRGFWNSCGVRVPSKTGGCEDGQVHLMSNAHEVRDAQHLFGMLADDGVIDPQRIGATGGSYGGGMAMQLGALKNRILRTDGSYEPWTSPRRKLPMTIAATAPNFGWSDLAQSLMPNGSTLDYAAYNPYTGPNGDRRFGVQKQAWNASLYSGGQTGGWYAPANTVPSANIEGWNAVNNTGGPYDGDPVVNEQIGELPRHGAYGVDDTETPAPVLLSNGWNDDLFPVDEAVTYYNKIRTNHPDASVSMFHLDFGHGNRAGGTSTAALQTAENAWFDHYVRGRGPAPADAAGGVTAIPSACTGGDSIAPSGQTPTQGTPLTAKTWAALAPGEIRVRGAARQTVAPDTAPATTYSGAVTVCTAGPSADTAGAAVLETGQAEAAFTLVGAPTIVADLTVQNANDALIGRLYDVDPSTRQERLIARGTFRPTGVGTTSRQVFQLHPQAYRIAPGHQVKLELLGQDAPYARPSTGQAPIDVRNVELRLPTTESPGALDGLVRTPAEKVLPAGYMLAQDFRPVPPTPSSPPVSGDGGVLRPSTPSAPAPAAKDPVAAEAALAILKRPLGGLTLSRSLRTLRFRDRLPEAGRVLYGVSIRVKGRTYQLGSSTRRVTKAGQILVTIRPSARGRRLLQANPRARITVRSYFVTAVERRHLNTVRTLKRR